MSDASSTILPLRMLLLPVIAAVGCIATSIAYADDPENDTFYDFGSGFSSIGSGVPIASGSLPPVFVPGTVTRDGSISSSSWLAPSTSMTRSGGGGGAPTGQQPNKGVPVNNKNANQSKPCDRMGNPIVFTTGNKIESETDFDGKGQFPLFLNRTYNSFWPGTGIFGRYWVSNFDVKLIFGGSYAPTSTCYPRVGSSPTCQTNAVSIYAERADGRVIQYTPQGGIPNQWYENRPGGGVVSRIVATGSTFTLYSEERTVEVYDATGFPLSVKSEQGAGWTFAWTSTHYLTSVSHTNGRAVKMTWNGNQLASVTDPTGNAYTYTYAANKFGSGQHLLTQTIQPVNTTGVMPTTTRAYQYENATFPGALTGVTLNLTRYSWFVYDSSGRAIESYHAGNVLHNYFSYTSDSSGGVGTVITTNPLGLHTTIGVSNGSVTSMSGAATTNCPATSIAITYDTYGYPSHSVDPKGVTTDTTYNQAGQLVKKIEDSANIARVTTYAWDTNNHKYQEVIAGYLQTDVTYTTDGRVASVKRTSLNSTGGTGRALTTTYTYTKNSTNGLLATMVVTPPLSGAALTYSFDSNGDLASVSNSLGHTTTYTNYNAFGLVGTITSTNGAVTNYTYDSRGNIASIGQVIGSTSYMNSYGYNVMGEVTSQVTADGRRLYYGYDAAFRLTTEQEVESTSPDAKIKGQTDAYTRATNYGYNPLGNVTAVAKGHSQSTWTNSCMDVTHQTPSARPSDSGCGQPYTVTTFKAEYSKNASYDELGRVIAVKGNNNQSIKTTYDLDGNLSSQTDSLGNVKTYSFDGLNRLVQVKLPYNTSAYGTTSFSYDLGDQITQVVDGRYVSTTFTRDGFGLVWQQSSGDTGSQSANYNSYGQMSSQTRADGTQITYSYDAIGRVVSAAVGAQSQTFTYDNCTAGKGMLCSAADATGSTSLGYTAQGAVASRRITVTGLGAFNLSFQYDALNRLISQTNEQSGVGFSYQYAFGRVSNIQAVIGGTGYQIVSAVAYNANNAPISFLHGNNLSKSIVWDIDGRQIGLASASTTVTAQSLGLSFDANDRVAAISNAVVAGMNTTFSYAPSGGITGIAPASGSAITITYDGNGNRTTQGTAAEAVGILTGTNRLVSRGTQSYTYDANGNRLTETVSGVTTSYVYNAFNRLSSVSRPSAVNYCEFSGACPTYPAGTTTYGVNALGRRVSKTGPTGTFLFAIGDSGELQAEYGANIYSDYVYLGGQLVAIVRNGVLYHVDGDQLGRPEIVTNSQQRYVWSAKNYPFDRSVTFDTIGGLNIGFPGQYYDAETGHWSNGFRDYDSGNGRYLQSDPLGVLSGTNPYAYVGGNPILLDDPYGLFCMTKQAKDVASATVGGAVQGAVMGAGTGVGAPLAAIANGVASGVATYYAGVAGGAALAGAASGYATGGASGSRAVIAGGVGGLLGTLNGGTVGVGAVAGALGGFLANAPNLSSLAAASGVLASGLKSGGLGAVASTLTGATLDAINAEFGDCGCGR